MNTNEMTLRAADVTPAELQQLLADLTLPADQAVRCWLEAPDGWALDYWPGLEGAVHWNGAARQPTTKSVQELLPRITTGRLFDPAGELKWRVLPVLGQQCCRVVFLGKDWPSETLNALPMRHELQGLVSSEESYPLWGRQTERTPGEWIDLRIPHRLRYPVEIKAPTSGRVHVKVENWKDARGQTQFVRLCELTTG